MLRPPSLEVLSRRDLLAVAGALAATAPFNAFSALLNQRTARASGVGNLLLNVGPTPQGTLPASATLYLGLLGHLAAAAGPSTASLAPFPTRSPFPLTCSVAERRSRSVTEPAS